MIPNMGSPDNFPPQEILFGQQTVHWLPTLFSNMNHQLILVILRKTRALSISTLRLSETR